MIGGVVVIVGQKRWWAGKLGGWNSLRESVVVLGCPSCAVGRTFGLGEDLFFFFFFLDMCCLGGSAFQAEYQSLTAILVLVEKIRGGGRGSN